MTANALFHARRAQNLHIHFLLQERG
jgi:hypothetical protein